jgi:hypothetical protein
MALHLLDGYSIKPIVLSTLNPTNPIFPLLINHPRSHSPFATVSFVKRFRRVFR